MCTPVMTRFYPPDYVQPCSNVDQMPASTSVALQIPAMTFGTEYMTPARTDSINFMIRRQSPPRPSPYNHRGCEDRDDRTAPRLLSLYSPSAVSDFEVLDVSSSSTSFIRTAWLGSRLGLCSIKTLFIFASSGATTTGRYSAQSSGYSRFWHDFVVTICIPAFKPYSPKIQQHARAGHSFTN